MGGMCYVFNCIVDRTTCLNLAQFCYGSVTSPRFSPLLCSSPSHLFSLFPLADGRRDGKRREKKRRVAAVEKRGASTLLGQVYFIFLLFVDFVSFGVLVNRVFDNPYLRH